jgi:hypothetical protein
MDNSIIFLIENAISTLGSHYDIAKVVYEIYKDDYKVLNKKWYKFEKDMWIRVTKKELNLRNNLSEDISNKFLQRGHHYNNQASIETNEGQKEIYLTKGKISLDIALKLKNMSFRDNVIKECKCLFVDDE